MADKKKDDYSLGLVLEGYRGFSGKVGSKPPSKGPKTFATVRLKRNGLGKRTASSTSEDSNQ